MTFPAQDPGALARAVSTLLDDDAGARHMARAARAMVRTRYGWATIAARTAATYRATIANTPENRAQARARLAVRRPGIVVPEGNLLALAGAR
jgi:glycogen(starch) synthase